MIILEHQRHFFKQHCSSIKKGEKYDSIAALLTDGSILYIFMLIHAKLIF